MQVKMLRIKTVNNTNINNDSCEDKKVHDLHYRKLLLRSPGLIKTL